MSSLASIQHSYRQIMSYLHTISKKSDSCSLLPRDLQMFHDIVDKPLPSCPYSALYLVLADPDERVFSDVGVEDARGRFAVGRLSRPSVSLELRGVAWRWSVCDADVFSYKRPSTNNLSLTILVLCPACLSR